MTLGDALVRVLGGGNTDELSAAVTSASASELAASVLDVLFCYWVRGQTAPAEVRARAQVALDGAPMPERVALAMLLGEPTDEQPAPPDGDWEELASWAVAAAPMALPNLERGATSGREEDLRRGLGLALLLRNAPTAARLLRWLSLSVPAAELLEAIHDTLRIARRHDEGLVAALVARAVMQRAHIAAPPPQLRSQPRGAGGLSAARQHAFLDGAIGWVEGHLERFTVPPELEPVALVARFKAVGELALVASRVIAAGELVGEDSWCRRGRGLLAFSRAQIGDGDRLAALVETTPPLAVFVTILPPLYRDGLRNERLRAAVARHAGTVARDLAFFVGVGMRDIGLMPPWDLETAWGWTRIVREPAPWRVPPAELYLLLHEVWYRAADGWPDDRGRAYITRWLPVWIRYVEMVGHHDLLAELLITWHAVHATPAPASAWNALLNAQRGDGAVPTTRDNASAGTDIMTDEYHATLNGIWAAVTHPAP